MNYTENTPLATYVGSVKHLINGNAKIITFPPTWSNSFAMATAFFERQALNMSRCGLIIEIVVEKLDKNMNQFKEQ